MIIPAHNEAARLPGTLRRLYADGRMRDVVVIIACNGCSDDTADRARAALAGLDHRATVVELPEPGKARAIRTVEATLPPGPRLILDADAGCDGATAVALLTAVDDHGWPVAVPERVIVTDGIRHPLVRGYYRVWQDFPWIRAMPSGRAAYALSWAIRLPQGPFPDLIGDDQWATSLVPRDRIGFLPERVDVHPVPTLRELLAVRTRVYRGNREAGRAGSRAAGSQRPALLRAARSPRNWPGLATFLVVDRLAHRRARSERAAVWTKR